MLILDLREIGNRLLAVRKRAGLTQAELAEKAGLADRTYADIERGKDHRVGAVLQPAALLRHGKPIGLAAKISVGGKEVASKSEGEGRLKTAEKWWEDPKIVDAPVVQRRDGYLIDRMKSPFQLQDNDNYEESR